MAATPQFKDYNFDGSNLSALIRLLGYNTFKNSFYLNMVMAEGFLDTAQTRSSVLSHAKELNYTPRSAKSAKASLSFTFQGTQPSYLIQKGSTFSSTVKNTGMVFSVPSPLLITSSNNFFVVSTDVYEGAYLADSYVMNYSDQTQRFIISNPNVDTDSLVVMVYQNGSVVGVPYLLSQTLLGLNQTSLAYFLQASETGQYEIQFGDGVVGYRPPDGSTIVLDYRVSKGSEANGAKQFNMNFKLGGANNAINSTVSNISKISTVAFADGGAEAEGIESIRYYAPRHFQIQERAVTATDYATLLMMNFPEIIAAESFGGEEADPPQYGKVFIALSIANVDGIPTSKRDLYAAFLKNRASLTVQPVFIVPSYLYLSIRSEVIYNINQTTLTASNISALVFNVVQSFAQTNLDTFNATLKYSRLTAAIDKADVSIDRNETDVLIYKKVSPVKGTVSDFLVNFTNQLKLFNPINVQVFPSTLQRTIRSNTFLHTSGTCYITDDGNGVLWIAQDRGAQTYLLFQTGTVNYATGTLTITRFRAEDYQGLFFKIYATPEEVDVSSQRDTILDVEADEIQISVTAVRL